MKFSCEIYPKLKVLTPAGTAQFEDGLFETDNVELAGHVGALDYVLAELAPVEDEEPADEPVMPTQKGKKANKVDD